MKGAPLLVDVTRMREQDARIEELHKDLTQLARDLRGDPRELDAWRLAIAFKELRRPDVVAQLTAAKLGKDKN